MPRGGTRTPAPKKPEKQVRLYVPDSSTIEVWEDDICRIRLTDIKQVILDNGKTQTPVKVA